MCFFLIKLSPAYLTTQLYRKFKYSFHLIIFDCMPRKRRGAFKTAQEASAEMGRKAAYSFPTKAEFNKFMYGYLGKEKFKEFKREHKRKKREKNK